MHHKLIRFHEISDDRGGLISLEQHRNIPFEIKRVYYIYDTPYNVRRGFHAHKNLKQMAVCVKGSCSFLIDDGQERVEYRLDSSDKGLLIGAMVWREMFDFSDDCVLMVLASEYYDESDYIRSYDEFKKVNK